MSERQTIAKTQIPGPRSITDIEVGAVHSRGQEPPMDTLRAARNLLLAEYGPCAASHPELLLATARRLQRDADRASVGELGLILDSKADPYPGISD